jgi:hypothetical protein
MVCIAAACGNERSVVLASDQMFTVPAPNNLEFETRKKRDRTARPSHRGNSFTVASAVTNDDDRCPKLR